MLEGFQFDKIIVIEGLNEIEWKTGTDLYNDLLSRKVDQIEGFSAVHKSVSTLEQLEKVLDEVRADVLSNGTYPIIHFEIHGNPSGLVLPSNELMSWESLYTHLIEINIPINNNLFITLAVCQGAYLMKEIKPTRPCPFWGFIGSFDTLWSSDVLLRYTEFYSEFLSSFNLDKAVRSLQQANTAYMPGNYRFINSEAMFKRVYNLYLETQYDPAVIRQRFENAIKHEGVKFKDAFQKNLFFLRFKSELFKTKKEFFEKHRDIFFMTDKYPQNKELYLMDYNPPLD